MQKEIIKKVEAFAKHALEGYNEDPEYWIHVELVRKYALKLAEIEKTDKEIAEIASLLHDIGKCKGKEGHPARGYEMAKEFLKEINFPEKKKELILKCILKHGSEFAAEDNELEVKIMQSADALGTIFDDKWQEHCRKTMTKEELLKKYEKMSKKINLDSARKIAEPQLKKLMSLL
jgi:putative nucleotidyltransferase with HDIG domain